MLMPAPNAAGATAGTNFASEGTYEFTNSSGQSFFIYTGESDGPDVIGQPIPSFLHIVSPVLTTSSTRPMKLC